MGVPHRLVRTILTALNRLRLLLRAVTGRGRAGVHAVPLTPGGAVVLVRLTYAPGWRLPGGGVDRGESDEAAMLRELREEIGLTRHGAIEPLEALRPRSDRSSLFLVRDVTYSPRRSLEVEEVREFDPDDLPEDISGGTRETLEALSRRDSGAR